MKKTLLIFFIGASIWTGAAAQSKLSPMGRMIVSDYMEMKTLNADMKGQDSEYAAIVTLKSTADAEQLTNAGIEIVSNFGKVVTANIPVSRMEEISELPGVVYLQFGESQEPTMNFARPAGGVDEAQEGFTFNGTPHSYDGTGVIAGLFDGGMDANHCNFKDDNNASRVQRLWWFRGNNGTSTQYTNTTVSSFSTDDSEASHATHVAGIMAGGFKGTAQVAKLTNPSTGAGITVGSAAMPYYGVATGSSLAFSVGSLTDANILNGVEKIVSYAEQQGMPCVVNLSLGSTSGPHDGSTAYNEGLAALGKRAIICMSAGNDGDVPLYVNKEFSSATDDLKTMIAPANLTNGNSATGIVDVWGKTNKVLSVSWAVYNASTRALTTIATISSAGASQSISSSTAVFSTAFSGTIRMVSEVNPLNNRYHVQCALSGVSRKTTASTSYLALVVKAVNGEAVYVYGNTDISFTSNSLVGWTTGSTDGTINDGACGENIISVGASTSAKWFPTLSRGVYSYNGATAPGTIAPFSSYGTTFQGVNKPDVTGPGTAIVSSYSRFYVSTLKLGNTNLCASVTRSGVTNYWGPMQGTSMSCPFVSGVVALWLQANPNLKYEDVMKVIKNSSDFNSLTMRPAMQWGAGKINAVEGLKYILTNAGIGTVETDDPAKAVILTPTMGGYEISVAGAAEVNASLYSVSGMQAKHVSVPGNTAALTTDGLPSGIYVLSVETPVGRYTTKLAVK
mgnify:CR=1 FL=1|jgi:hypothetical protein